MSKKIKSSAREARDTGFADKLYLCGERVAVALRLAANGVSHHIKNRLSSVWGSHATQNLRPESTDSQTDVEHSCSDKRHQVSQIIGCSPFGAVIQRTQRGRQALSVEGLFPLSFMKNAYGIRAQELTE